MEMQVYEVWSLDEKTFITSFGVQATPEYPEDKRTPGDKAQVIATALNGVAHETLYGVLRAE